MAPESDVLPLPEPTPDQLAERQRLYEETAVATLIIQTLQQSREVARRAAWRHLMELVLIVEPLCELINQMNLKVAHADYVRVRREYSEGGVVIGSLHLKHRDSLETINQGIKMILKVPSAVRHAAEKA